MQVEKGAQLQEPSLVELSSGIDTMYLSGKVDLPSTLLEKMTLLRTAAQDNREAVRAEFGGTEIAVNGWGRQKYRYCLEHPFGWIGLSSGGHLPAVRIEPNAECLHGLGPNKAIEWFVNMVELECGQVDWTVNRLDVYADWQGWAINGDDRDRFLCRATSLHMDENNGAFETFQFGRRKTNTVSARIYDKTAEMIAKGNDYWLDIWGESLRTDLPVIRIELECGRSGLRQLGIKTPEEALANAGGVWKYGTEEYLTHRVPGPDSNKSRWAESPEWTQVQKASLSTGAQGLKRMYAGRLKGDFRRLAPLLNGVIASYAAVMGASTIDEVSAYIPRFLKAWEIHSGVPFVDRVALKRRWVAT